MDYKEFGFSKVGVGVKEQVLVNFTRFIGNVRV